MFLDINENDFFLLHQSIYRHTFLNLPELLEWLFFQTCRSAYILIYGFDELNSLYYLTLVPLQQLSLNFFIVGTTAYFS